jgi:hypothetical protein
METKKLSVKLGQACERLKNLHPDQARQVEDGLLVALAGGVRLVGEVWEVRAPHFYRVRLFGTPVRWHCTCPQGTSFGQVVTDFYGHPGRVCKHVGAVAVCLLAGGEVLGRPSNLLNLVRRICMAGAAVHGEGIRDLPLKTRVRLVRVEEGAPSLRLRHDRVTSDDLAWGVQEDGGMVWMIDPEIEERYRDWKARVEEKIFKEN